jgi:hypothetical protein
MKSAIKQGDKRRQERVRAVLPVRLWGTDEGGKSFEELAHTLDIAPSGGRLGSIHRCLRAADRITVQYRQHKMEFRVIWTKLLDNTHEYQVGLQAVETDRAAWGLTLGARSVSSANSPAAVGTQGAA